MTLEETMGQLPVKVMLRRFKLKRIEDESGISGVGYVAEGIQFSDGTAVIHWISQTACTGIYRSVVELIHIHGHGGKTIIEWVDPEFEEPVVEPKKKTSKSVSKK